MDEPKYWGGAEQKAKEPSQICAKHGEYGLVQLQFNVDGKHYKYAYCPFCWGEDMSSKYEVEVISIPCENCGEDHHKE